MFTALAIFFLILSLVLHEVGHAIAMKKYGVQIESAGFGFGPHLTFRIKKLAYPLTVGMLPLGAYVKPTEVGGRHLRSLPFKQQCVVYAAGSFMNFLLAFGILVIVIPTTAIAGGHGRLLNQLVALGILGLLLLSCYKWVEKTSAYVAPLFGILSLAGLVVVLLSDPSGVSGPVGIVQLSASSSILQAEVFGFAVSLSLGLFNLTPLMPLDGGHILAAAIRSRAGMVMANLYSTSTAICMFVFVLFVITKDVWAL